jgi:hypothetical protein
MTRLHLVSTMHTGREKADNFIAFAGTIYGTSMYSAMVVNRTTIDAVSPIVMWAVMMSLKR